jgi:hypothetical protein
MTMAQFIESMEGLLRQQSEYLPKSPLLSLHWTFVGLFEQVATLNSV